jgi:kynurenine 3-monooxygenase
MSAEAGSGSPRVLIVGAGLAGSLMAVYLAKAGWRVSVYERRPDPRAAGYVGGRSINLALSARGLAGLAGAGLAELVMQQDAIPMRGRMIHPPDSTDAAPRTIFQPYSHDPKEAINSVSRGGLNLTLIKAAAAHPNVEFIFDHPCVDMDLAAPAGVFQKPGGGTVRVEADLIIGADGAFSAVRGRLQLTDRYDYSQSYLEHGYKELHIPPQGGPGAGASRFAMEPNALHIWPRGGAMMIALPNRDQSFTCTLFWPFKGEHGFENLRTPEGVRAFFERNYGDAVPLMPTLTDDFFGNPTSSLVTVRCWPWRQGNIVLIGDAAHAIVPFYGQGMNAAFEDCLLLARLLTEHSPARTGPGLDFSDALERFQQDRKPNADAIADMALENFVEMRDKTGSPAFLYRKKIEQTVHHFFPDRVTPQYNLVSFSTVPYTEARRRGRSFDLVLDRIIERLPRDSLSTLGEEAWKSRVRALADDLPDRASPAGPIGMAAPRAPDLLFDITPAVTEKLGVWPGDTPLSREVLCDIERGDNITLSTLRATVHLGAHADGPNHYGKGQPGIGERPLVHYLGPCHVIRARVCRGARVTPGDLSTPLAELRHPRVLLKTSTFPEPNNWNQDFGALSVELVEALAARGVITIGIDTPSVDLQDSKDLPAHHAILRHDIAILEGLDLSAVEPGEYDLMALPLKLIGFDASPIRAVLRPLSLL